MARFLKRDLEKPGMAQISTSQQSPPIAKKLRDLCSFKDLPISANYPFTYYVFEMILDQAKPFLRLWRGWTWLESYVRT